MKSHASTPRVLILGAGISGLSVAFRLQQILPQADITVLEPRARPGGSIWTEHRQGFHIEIGPNGFLDNKPTTMELCHDLGLGGKLVAASDVASKNRYLFVNGRLKPLPSGILSFVQSDLLSWRGKLSLLMERFRPARLDQTDESVHDFATRRAGREAAEVFADALVTGIHAGDPRLLSMSAAFPRVAAMEREFGSVMKGLRSSPKATLSDASQKRDAAPGRKMWSFREGLRLLVETLCGQLKNPPLFGVQVRRLLKNANGEKPVWVASSSNAEGWLADVVILACPTYQQAALLADLDGELADKIAGIPYNRVAVVGLGYRRQDVPGSLDGFGYIAPQRDRRDLLGVQWCSSIFPDRAPEGAVLLRAMCGGWNRAEVVGWDDDRLLTAVRAELRQAMGISAAPIMHHIVRWDRAIPQYHLGHVARVAWIEGRICQYPGLFLTGNAFHGIAMNDCTEQGAQVALRVAAFLSKGSTTSMLYSPT